MKCSSQAALEVVILKIWMMAWCQFLMFMVMIYVNSGWVGPNCLKQWGLSQLPFAQLIIAQQRMLPAVHIDAGWVHFVEPWWRHQIETFSALLAICSGNSPVPGEFPTQRPVTRSFDVFFDLRLNKRLSKQSWGCWLETPSCPLWCHCNALALANGIKLLLTL